MEQSCNEIPFSILQFTKKAEKAVFWSRIRFFGKFAIFAYKLLSFRILHLAYPKLVGTPCTLHITILCIFQVSKEHYKKVSSFARSAILFGRFTSGLASQLLSSFNILDYGQLNYVSLISVIIAFAFSLILPSVDQSIYFHQKNTGNVFMIIGSNVKNAYKNHYVVKWSFWFALATCGNFQIGNYIQSLWIDIDGK